MCCLVSNVSHGQYSRPAVRLWSAEALMVLPPYELQKETQVKMLYMYLLMICLNHFLEIQIFI